MGKKSKNAKKGAGAAKTAMKTDKKLAAKQKKMLEKLGEADITEAVLRLEQEQARLKAAKEEVCAPPSPRSNFTLITHPAKKELILFGGEFFNGQRVCVHNDLFFYNIQKNEWRQLLSPSGPTPRSGHQMVSVATDSGQLWLFGGEYASPSQLQFYHYKDMWMMNLTSKQWEKINAPNGPSARSGHRMVVSKKRIVVFGGFHDNNQSYQYFNDVHVFSLDTYTWLKVDVSGTTVPAPRSGCCIAAYSDGGILIWGGYSKTRVKKDVDRGVTHTDMFALLPEKSDASEKLKWSTVKPGGYKPLPRSSVGYTTSPNGKVYCFGGVMDVSEDDEDLSGQFGSDLLTLDLVARTWRMLEVEQKTALRNKATGALGTNSDIEMQDDKDSHGATVSSDGVFTVTVAGPSASLPKVPSLFPNRHPKSLPSPRMSPGLAVCKGSLYLYGGVYEEDNKQRTYNDFYALDLQKLDEWKILKSNDASVDDWIDSESSNSEDEDDSDSGSEDGSHSGSAMETDTDEES